MYARYTPIALCIFLLFTPTPVFTQCTTNQVPDFTAGPIGGDTISRTKITPMFGFEMLNDTCRTMYRIADVKNNGSPITLYGWCGGQDINDWEANKLSDSTRTNAFSIHTGDTISFYRELAWYNPIVKEQNPDNYFAKDTLDYSIELIRASTNERIALLDSIGVLRRVTVGAPVLYGTHPIIAVVKYGIPSTLNNESVRIRVRVRSRGDGDHYFVRTDRFSFALSDRLEQQVWHDYLDAMGGGLGKKNIGNEKEIAQKNSTSLTRLNITPNPTPSRIKIDFSHPDDHGSTSIVITDSDGNIIFVPFSTFKTFSDVSTYYDFPASGTYYVSLFHNQQRISIEKIVVVR